MTTDRPDDRWGGPIDALRDDVRLLSCLRMGQADQAAIELGISGLELMENAGRAVADVAQEMVGGRGRVLVFCGPGNNGGDGFVAARHLVARGREVVVALLGKRDQLHGDAGEMARRWTGDVHKLSSALVDDADLVIDALFGAGLNRPIERDSELGRFVADVQTRQFERSVPLLAVDVPSGMNGDTGQAVGACFTASRTVTFFRRKPGHLLLPGRSLCGEVDVVDIGIPDGVLRAPYAPAIEEPSTFVNDGRLWRHEIGDVSVEGHKYTRGHALVVSGGIEMSGAARLAARAALRIGAGLVTVASPPDALVAHASQLNAVLLAKGQEAPDLRRQLEDVRKNAVVIGPGMGLEMGLGGGALARVLAVLSSPASVVLDADALTAASEASDQVFAAIGGDVGRSVVLTPHEGEFARLFGVIAGSKLGRAREASRRSGGVVVLKGADTVIAAPDGRAAINENAPPWLATAGSGDVLSGLIGGLLAQRVPAFEAACAAVWIHGDAANRFGRGLIAEDLVEMLPQVLQGLFGGRRVLTT